MLPKLIQDSLTSALVVCAGGICLGMHMCVFRYVRRHVVLMCVYACIYVCMCVHLGMHVYMHTCDFRCV